MKRYLVLGHLGAERTAEVVRDSLIAAGTELPATLHRTATRDQDAEIAEHRSFPMATDIRVYFADPGAARQRDSATARQRDSATATKTLMVLCGRTCRDE
ncbi:hypothetical protein ATM97_29525 [Nocardia sp. MH4]|uniref:hypothetical protein n=1 Tax=Nocardia TaxID=1817 RepID=UPI0007A4D4EB|nr:MULTISPECIES: hypothetical protein [Nocardia]MBW0275417.1 hypothetical protein [Nocardia sp. MH4]